MNYLNPIPNTKYPVFLGILGQKMGLVPKTFWVHLGWVVYWDPIPNPYPWVYLGLYHLNKQTKFYQYQNKNLKLKYNELQYSFLFKY